MTLCLINKFDIDGTRIDEGFKSQLKVDDVHLTDPQNLEGYSVVDCDLKKELLKPSEFTFTLRHHIPSKKSYDVFNKLIGKSVYCNALTFNKDGSFDTKLHFSGIIDSVYFKGLNITCIAYSEDCKLQGPAKCRCFYDMKIADIVKAVVSDHKIENQIEIQSEIVDLSFPYIVQYNENDYDFLVRLAKRFGAFFYYHDMDPTILPKKCVVFGKLPSGSVKAIDSAKAVSYKLETGNSNYRFAVYHGEKDLPLLSPGSSFDAATRADKFTKLAVDGSTEYTSPDKKYYIDYPYSLTKTPKQDDIELHNAISLISDASRLVTCKFICSRFDVQVGDLVTVDDHGVLVVTAVHLTWDCSGAPQNEVTAMRLPNENFDLNKTIAPYVDFNAYPKSSAQRALVINNVDPQKIGRVQVLFNWQLLPASDDEKKRLPWIRIAQPYGGGKKDKGQGFYLLPEIGEEVMVGFEHDNMEKPFVIGSLYHDSDTADDVQMPEESWVETDQANKKNEVKAFRTKKGHTIEFHDVDGDDKYGFIRIYGNEKKDGPNYDIILSTDPIKDKDYTIESASMCDEGKDNFKIDKLRVLVRSNGGDIMLDAGDGDIVMNAMNIRLHTQQDLTAYIGGKEVITVEDTHFLETKDSGLHVKNNREVLIDEKDDYSSKNLVIAVSEDSKFSAKSLTLKTDQKTEIKASSLEASADHSVEINANSGLELNGGSKTDLKATNVTVKGDSSATLKATDVTVDGLFSTTVSGANLTIDATMGTRKGSWTDV